LDFLLLTKYSPYFVSNKSPKTLLNKGFKLWGAEGEERGLCNYCLEHRFINPKKTSLCNVEAEYFVSSI